MDKLQVSVFTKQKGILTKEVSLTNGKIKKDASQCQISKAHFKVRTLDDLFDFDLYLDSLASTQALAYGRPTKDKKLIVSKNLLDDYPKAMTRTKDNFVFQGPTILMLDYDPESKDEALSPQELRDIFLSIVPEAEDVDMLWRPSASSCIWNTETDEEVVGVAGQRLYLIIQDGTKLEQFTKWFECQLWLRGYGRFVLSASGAMLARTVWDTAVWSPERLDFAAGAVCKAPLERRSVNSILWDGDKRMLALDQDDYEMVLDSEREMNDLKKAGREALVDQQKIVIQQYIVNRAAELIKQNPELDHDKVVESLKMATQDHPILTADFVVKSDKYGLLKVADLLQNKDKYEGITLADPLEPDYGGGRNKSKAFLAGTRPMIRSLAHGGRNFVLTTQTYDIQAGEGRLNNIILEVGAGLAREPDIFCNDAGPLMVIPNAKNMPRTQILNEATMTARVASMMKFHRIKVNNNGEVTRHDMDPPARAVQNLTNRKDRWGLRELRGIITAPTLRPDGTLLRKTGYDEATGFLFVSDESELLKPIPTDPDDQDIDEALALLMEPFEGFSFERTAEDKAILLTAILTAVVRKALPTAPGFIISATTAGSGKTKLAQCIDILAGGDGATQSYPYDKEEMRKTVMGAMMESAPTMLFDNLGHNPNSEFLCAVLSSAEHTERILGRQERARLSTQMLFLFTGNNIHAAGDLNRRTLRINLDPRCENPWKRKFSFDPVVEVRRRRQELTAAALTVLRGYYTAGCPRVIDNHTGSYELWSEMVRSTVKWKLGIDPEISIEENHVEDEETDTLRLLMHYWNAAFGDRCISNEELASIMSINTGLEEPEIAVLRDFITQEILVWTPKPNVNNLAKWLGYRKGRIIDGMRFDKYRSRVERGWMLKGGEAKDDFDIDLFFDN